MSVSICSFSSTIHRAQTFILVFSASDLPIRTNTFCCLRLNVEAFCHKQDSLVRGATAFVVRGRRTTHTCYKPITSILRRRNVDDMRRSSSNRCKSQLLVKDRDFCLPHLHSTPPLGGSPSEYCHNVWCRTRGQSNLTKSAPRGAHSPVRGHPRGSKVVPLNPGIGFPISVP